MQTTQPSHPVMEFVRSHDYKGFFDVELEERRRFHYPPFTRLISITDPRRNTPSCPSSAASRTSVHTVHATMPLNMLMQVAGRAGRRDIPGRVLVQTTQPSHPVMEFVRSHDYKGYHSRQSPLTARGTPDIPMAAGMWPRNNDTQADSDGDDMSTKRRKLCTWAAGRHADGHERS